MTNLKTHPVLKDLKYNSRVIPTWSFLFFLLLILENK